LNKKTPIEMEKFAITKATRTLIRLKHSIRADYELNDVLPDRLDEFDSQVQRGKLLGFLEPSLDDVLGD